MKLTKQDLVDAQVTRANEAFRMAELAIEANFWNSAASELYYTSFYLIHAVFLVRGIKTKTHAGTKTLFSQHFIKESYIDEKYGKLFAKLFNYRQEGDYGNYMLTADLILPFVAEVKEFKKAILDLLKQSGYKTNNQS